MDNIPNPDPKAVRWIVFSVAFVVFMVRLDSYIVNISLSSGLPEGLSRWPSEQAYAG